MIVLDFSNVFKIYNNSFIALNGITFNVKRGDFFSILGKNGAGKSTLIGILSSLINKTYGKIYISGYDLDYDSLYIKSLLGFVPQDFNFNQFETVYNIIVNQANFYGLKYSFIKNRLENLLKLFDLWDYRFSLSINLSGGMKRRLMFIRALIHDPEILILDEPTAGIDIFSKKLILEFLQNFNKMGKTILLTTHNFDEIEILCNKIIIIDKGIILKEIDSKILDMQQSDIYFFKIDDIKKLINIKDFEIKILDNNLIEFISDKNNKLHDFLKSLLDNDILIINILNKNNKIEKYFFNLNL